MLRLYGRIIVVYGETICDRYTHRIKRITVASVQRSVFALWYYNLITISLQGYRDLSIYLSIYGFTALVDLGRFFSFLIYTQSLGLFGRGFSPSQGRYLHTDQHKHRIKTQTFMPRVRFEPTIRVLELAKTARPL
jgi:hypothetical protein